MAAQQYGGRSSRKGTDSDPLSVPTARSIWNAAPVEVQQRLPKEQIPYPQ